MTERVDALQYDTPATPSTVEGQESNLFLTGPAEFLCSGVAAALRIDPSWSAIFGDYIDPYMRMDYPQRALPVVRVFNEGYTKEYESWFINGVVHLDMIWPASIRRAETQQIPETVAAAMLQQFRRPSFFEAVAASTPGLNELGKTYSVDNALAFQWGDSQVPVIRITANFRMDLRAWDDYLESDYRTKDEPFTRTLGDLTRIVSTIQALRDDDVTEELEIQADQSTT